MSCHEVTTKRVGEKNCLKKPCVSAASFLPLARRAHAPAQNKTVRYKTLQNTENAKELDSGYNCN